MDYNHFFNTYGYVPQDGWTGREKQLKDAGLDTSGIEIVNGKGVSNNGQYAQYSENEGEYMSYPEQLVSIGIDESEYGLAFGKGYVKTNGEKTTSNYLTFTAVEANSTIKLEASLMAQQLINISLQYSTDGENWNDYTIKDLITLNSIGDSVMFRGENTQFNISDVDAEAYYYFAMTGKISGSGDITSLLNNIGGDVDLLSEEENPVSFYNLFKNCSSLTTAPKLPSTTLADECYSSMFYGCTSLTTAPELPAETLETSCYNSMFSGCTSLNKVTCLATDNTASSCTVNWLKNVSNTGVFTKALGMNNWTTGVNGIPSDWTVENV